MKYEWLLFDADNTLFDYDQAETFALASMFTLLGYPFQDGYGDAYRKINHEFWLMFEAGEISQDQLRFRRFETLFSHLGMSINGKDASHIYLRFLGSSTHLVDGARQIIDQLRHSHRLALITNGLQEVQRSRLRNTGLGKEFEAIVISDEVGVAKPDAGIFDIAFARMNCPERQRVLIIGDSITSDMRGGHAYGLDTCWFNPMRRQLVENDVVTFEIHSLWQLPELLHSS